LTTSAFGGAEAHVMTTSFAVAMINTWSTEKQVAPDGIGCFSSII
jgi:hypothetical protein